MTGNSRTVGFVARLREGYEDLDPAKPMEYGQLFYAGLEPLGTTFAYRHENLFLTAAHCVRDQEASRLRVLHFDTPTEVVRRVDSVAVHPSADLAALQLVPDGFAQFAQPSPGNLAPLEMGVDVFAVGYPIDVVSLPVHSQADMTTVPRLFKGHVQRMMTHESVYAYTYAAAELNFPCPSGLSGGPVYPEEHPALLAGMVTASLRSSTYVDAVLEPGGSESTPYQFYRVVEYGVCLLFGQVSDWLALRYGEALGS